MSTFYEEVGGEQTFYRITERFYQEVAQDEILLPMYPEQPDLEPARRRLELFLAQYWGGPHTYSQERGHPRLRMRHVPYSIGPIERDAWLRCMTIAVDSIDDQTLDDEHRGRLTEYLTMAANSLMNRPF